MAANSIESARRRYAIKHWSEGYFDINDDGETVVQPLGPEASVQLTIAELMKHCEAADLSTPVLMRFSDILHHRARTISASFSSVCEDLGYQGDYTLIYPIKVNQQRSVVECLASLAPDGIGLEAGSKAELFILLGMAPPGTRIVCNGFKDREFIRLALIGVAMGLDVHLIIENASDVDHLIAECSTHDWVPKIGLRVRLSAIAKGKWQNTGGERSKFGLSPSALMSTIRRLKAAGLADAVQLLHVHMGSQISHIRELQQGMREVARYYASLRELGLAVDTVDVGGGLAVDYDGSQSRSDCSANYELDDYARVVVRALLEECERSGLPHPAIFSESGRALVAYHALLVTDIVNIERHIAEEGVAESKPEDDPVVRDLLGVLVNVAGPPPYEVFHEAADMVAVARDKYIHGLLSLAQLARAEDIFRQICRDLRQTFRPESAALFELAERLDDKLADKALCNLSVFRSLPDIWALKQVFPILPLSGHEVGESQDLIIGDLTCDSDGRIDHYVSETGLSSYLRLPDGQGQAGKYLCFFLVGAYQEILGDIHNLLGAPNAVSFRFQDGELVLLNRSRGDMVSEVHRDTGFSTRELTERILASEAVANRRGFVETVSDFGSTATYLKLNQTD